MRESKRKFFLIKILHNYVREKLLINYFKGGHKIELHVVSCSIVAVWWYCSPNIPTKWLE